MGTKLWGPDTWYVIHIIADSSPDTFTREQTAQYERFYRSLAYVLPCPICSVHYMDFMKNDPPIFHSRMEALRWTVRAHNSANVVTGARVFTDDEGLAAIQAEIAARNSGSVRGRRPYPIEFLQDTVIVGGAGMAIGIFLAYIFLSRN
jgi:hypothetical protein